MQDCLLRREFLGKSLQVHIYLKLLDVEAFVSFAIPFKVGVLVLQILMGILTDRIAVIACLGNHGAHPFTLQPHLSIVDRLSQVAMAGILNKGFSF